MFSILHISDLHRSPGDNISNPELISALVGDQKRYIGERPTIRPPDAVVVSGDIIQGVPLGTPNATEELARQYDVAFEFLVGIADRFLGGDRTRVIIVPGNHDIDWVMAREAMTLVPSHAIPDDLPTELQRLDTPYRWSWKSRELYQITDSTAYRNRLAKFWEFFGRFYGSSSPRKVTSRDVAHIYSLCDGRIGVAAFNSCQGNDCFAFHGAIPRETIAQSHLDLVDSGGFELLMAVWHHNVEGPPYRSDYMDVDIVRGMIGRGFRVGLYGHHHRGEAGPLQIHLADRETMVVISAGSLCAGAKELPTGSFRGYNIIEIGESMCEARVHMREMSVANLFSPAHRGAFGGRSWIDLKWEQPADLAGTQPFERNLRIVIEQAETYLTSKRPLEAKNLLLAHHENLPTFGRDLLLEAGRQTKDDGLLMRLLTAPKSISELVELVEVCIRKKLFKDARGFTDQHAARLAMNEAHIAELRARISTAEAIAV